MRRPSWPLRREFVCVGALEERAYSFATNPSVGHSDRGPDFGYHTYTNSLGLKFTRLGNVHSSCQLTAQTHPNDTSFSANFALPSKLGVYQRMRSLVFNEWTAPHFFGFVIGNLIPNISTIFMEPERSHFTWVFSSFLKIMTEVRVRSFVPNGHSKWPGRRIRRISKTFEWQSEVRCRRRKSRPSRKQVMLQLVRAKINTRGRIFVRALRIYFPAAI